MKQLKNLITISILVALASQLNIELFGSDFRVSAGIILFAIFLFYYDDSKPITKGVLCGVSVYLFRLLIYFLMEGNVYNVIWSFLIEILFYTFYAIIYTILDSSNTKRDITRLFFITIVSDFGANFIEVFVRTLIDDSIFHIQVLITLILVAIIRSSIIWLILNGLKYYRMLLMKEEHEKRYKRLLWLIAHLKTEMYWMEKNMDNIETVMSNSYELFEKINNNEDEKNWADRAVTIARDVHEIKKDYQLAIRGLKEVTENKLQDLGMNSKDIITILDETMKREIDSIGKNIKILFEPGESFYTTKHYYLMSIFRNLIMNSIDSISDSTKEGKITFTHDFKDDKHIFIISDNGCGIDEENLDIIFSPGFSTKINYETGEINRGLGLSVVRDILEKQLDGQIRVSSKLGDGTSFYIYIPKKSLEENI